MRATVLSVALAVCCSVSAVAQLDDILKKADDALQHRDTSSLSDGKIIAGLKQALDVSTSKAVASTGKPDGFLKNEAIKILLPRSCRPSAEAWGCWGWAPKWTNSKLG